MAKIMAAFHKVLFLSLCLTITNCGAATNKHNVMSKAIDQIELFSNGKIIAIDSNSNYLIGEINGDWSETYPLKKIGLEFVNFTLAAEKGAYLIGGITYKTDDDIVAYRGRTVLINDLNEVLNTWNYDSTFNSADIHNSEIIGSTGHYIYHLLKTGEVKKLHTRDKETRNMLISVVLDKQGKIIICNPYFPIKSNTPFHKFGCYKKNDWTFEGYWNISTSKPVSCGNWLIEARQKSNDEAFSGIKVRELSTGKLVNEQRVSGANRFICVNDNRLMFNNGLTSYSLPELTPADKYSCHGEEKIKSIKHSNGLSICLTEQGNIGKLRVKPL